MPPRGLFLPDISSMAGSLMTPMGALGAEALATVSATGSGVPAIALPLSRVIPTDTASASASANPAATAAAAAASLLTAATGPVAAHQAGSLYNLAALGASAPSLSAAAFPMAGLTGPVPPSPSAASGPLGVGSVVPDGGGLLQVGGVNTGGALGKRLVRPPRRKSVPRGDYVCHKCGIPGHFIQDCPLEARTGPVPAGDLGIPGAGVGLQQQVRKPHHLGGRGGARTVVRGTRRHGGQNNPPPDGYVCRKCNKPGHWIQECPLPTTHDYSQPPPASYVCRRCGVGGHWIQQCPTNGNPEFDHVAGGRPRTAPSSSHSAALESSDGAATGADAVAEGRVIHQDFVDEEVWAFVVAFFFI